MTALALAESAESPETEDSALPREAGDMTFSQARDWLLAEKDRIDPTTGRAVTWKKLARGVGVPEGSLSSYTSPAFAGRKDEAARLLSRYRRQQEERAALMVNMPRDPGYIELPTARSISGMLALAHTGQMSMVCTGSGTGKTHVAEEYRRKTGNNVWMVTMSPALNRLRPMIGAVLEAVGGAARGDKATMAKHVIEMLRHRKGLLIVDEANHADLECLEQLRAWHDAVRVGVCLMGNEELYSTIRGSARRHAFGRLSSRLENAMVQDMPRPEDIAMYLDHWTIADPAIRRLLLRIGMEAGGGGLRTVRSTIVKGMTLASGEGRGLELADLREAEASRVTRFMRPVQ